LKPAQENSSQDPISKNSSQKRAGGVAQGVGPEFKPQYQKKKKKKKPHYFQHVEMILFGYIIVHDI
jgi:hypothetical protein